MHPLISKSSSPFTNPPVTVARTKITIGIIGTFIFPGDVEAIIFFLVFFKLYSEVNRDSIVLNSASSVFFCFFFIGYYNVWSSGHDYVIRLDTPFTLSFTSF